ncbi:aldose epimerase family protein [Asticcacaulis sp. 201]|uniref:aldose epimerase family protein n=1 Tax=Asticcacaulis sp. 201 TaxID=3028787 RepID=UPI0029169DD8|nr:aldose epimerase family protein [Asticcacaulis sp. 201]MDV6330326.1 aldose epimerase family protein [Asticcacaulis sp. 201]
MTRQWALAGAAATLIMAAGSGQAFAADAKRATFGRLTDGQTVEAVTLSNHKGTSATVITYGASLQALMTPDRNGKAADIALGYSDLKTYVSTPQYFGATVGRFANRIAAGKYSIDGKTYAAPVNNGVNSLHGGTKGFDKVNWTVVKVQDGDAASVEMTYVSPDGDMGYPGQMTVHAIYSLNENNELTIRYTATTTKPTIVNITNHAYWNLAGEGGSRSINEHTLTLLADAYLPTDAGAIPTGEIRKVDGTVFDFRKPTAIGARVRDAADPQIVFGRGYDHNWVASRTRTAAPRLMAVVEDAVSGRKLELLSDQPGIQFYSGNFLDGTSSGKSGHIYREGDAFVLEPQIFPDTPNQPDFGSAILRPGETYSNTLIYRFSTQ